MEKNNIPLIGKECFYIDKVTHSKKFDKLPLGKCIQEGIHNIYKIPIVWFEKPFLGSYWQYKSNIQIISNKTVTMTPITFTEAAELLLDGGKITFVAGPRSRRHPL